MKYAYFDSTAPQPAPVLGWYHVYDKEKDPDGCVYAKLPAAADLLELTDAQWEGRLATPYVQGSTLVSMTLH